ncbi:MULTISPECIES: hypothetical protein [unclassified Chryseobacterium]|uniref:hypothetical protein n=1 Tax=unclassified Chryseobacterium TaxID=2593645 RepID=UPI00300FD12A
MTHFVATEFDNRNKLEKYLNANGISYDAQGKNAKTNDLVLLKHIFKDLYWSGSAQWTEFATEQTLAEWSEGYLKYEIDKTSQLLTYTDLNGDRNLAWGVINPITGKVILAPALLQESVYQLAKTFIHEQTHSIDFKLGYLSNFMNPFNEFKAYAEEAKWTGFFSPKIKEYLPGVANILSLISFH